MAHNEMFGWDLLYKLHEPTIRNNNDVLMCLVHWTIIHKNFHCVGIGEDTTLPGPDEYSETLPNGWNCTINKYNLRYVYERKLYILSAISNDSSLIVNMNRIMDNHASGVCLDSSEVKAQHGPISLLVPHYNELISRVEVELISPMLCSAPCREAETQTNNDNYSGNFPRVEPTRSESSVVPTYRDISIPRPILGDPLREIHNPLRDLGRSDIDPLRGGGGMILPTPGFGGPPIPPLPGAGSGIVPGSIPAGARFDPYEPPGREPRPPPQRTPDHDHLPPPGYDDMFT